MPEFKSILVPGNFHHIFNRAVGNEKIFLIDENYNFFLKKFYNYTLPICDIYCYSLLPNHFHFLICVQNFDRIKEYYFLVKKKNLTALDNRIVNEFLMEQFSNFFNAYTKSFNKIFQRKGKLFMDSLNRKLITNESYFNKIVHYIHANPVQHNYCSAIDKWKYSSYNELMGNDTTLLTRTEVLEWFGNKERFKKFHEQEIFTKSPFKP